MPTANPRAADSVRHLISNDTLRALSGVLARLADRPDEPASDISRALLGEVRSALRGRTVVDNHALAQLCVTTLDAMADRAEIDSRGNYTIRATEAELADEKNGIQVVAEFDTLRAYLNRLATREATHAPLGALVKHYRAAIDLIGTLRASMENLGFYNPKEDDTQVNGGDAVDMLSELASPITTVLHEGLRHAGEPTGNAERDALPALADLIGQLHGLGVADWHGAEGLDLSRAEQVLRAGGYEVSGGRVAIAGPPGREIGPYAFETERAWVLSTEHIPYDLYEHLQASAASPDEGVYADFTAVASSPYQARIDVRPNEDVDNPTPHESLASLIAIARRHGFTHIAFDRDARVVPQLPRIGHGVPEACLESKASAPGMGS
ncbi:hypothetical protein [Dolichospermum phage Dfl-JY45]